MEACASAHYWARELKELGHNVRLMPAKDVMAYVKRGKNDAIDAAACCEAVGRPTVRTVPVKTTEQQAQLMQHRVRDLLIRQRTQAINALRSHLAELGIVAAQGYEGLRVLLAIVADAPIRACPSTRVPAYLPLLRRSLRAKPRLGRSTSAIVATVPDATIFKRGRDFAVGIVSREDSTGDKQRLGPISKQGDRYLRRTLIVGAFAVLRRARAHPEKYPWVTQLLVRKPAKVVAVAMANKTARIAGAVLTKKESYRVQTNTAA